MRINEIEIDRNDELIDRLINTISKDVIELYNELKAGSNNFGIHVEDTYSVDEITDFRARLKLLNAASSIVYNSAHQTTKIIGYIAAYLN